MTEPGTIGRESLKPAEVEQRSRRRLPSLGNGALVLSAVIVAAGLIGAALILRTGGDTTDLEEQVAELQQAAKAPGVVVGVELRCNLPNRGSVRGEGCEWYLDLDAQTQGLQNVHLVVTVEGSFGTLSTVEVDPSTRVAIGDTWPP